MAYDQKNADWHGKDLVDRDGEKISKLEDVYVDVETDDRCSARQGERLFGRHLTFLTAGRNHNRPDNL